MKQEWMPINPCPCKEPIGNPDDICICERSIDYHAAIRHKIELIDYLIKNEAVGVSIEDNEDEEIMMVEVETLESMLKQLEDKKNGN